MKLNQKQIDTLYEFTRKHYVEYYDLQTELVDHLANAIEKQIVEKPETTFDEALQTEFKKFGVCGFSDVVEERKASLQKKYNTIVWHHFKTFFTLPKTIGTLLASFLVFKALTLFTLISKIFFTSILVLFLIGIIIIGCRIYKRNKLANASNSKKWLFKEIIDGFGYSLGILNLPIQLFLQLDNIILLNPFWLAVLSFLLVSFNIFYYIILFIIPSKAEDYLIATYPEYKLVQ